MLKRLAFAADFMLCLLGLVACGSMPKPGPTVYVPVDKPRAVSCVPKDLKPPPADLETRQSLDAIPDGPGRYVRMAADWAARAARMDETEPVVKGCQAAAPPP